MAVGLGPLSTLHPVPGFELGIASAGIILPVGTIVDLPEPPAARARLRETVKLWS